VQAAETVSLPSAGSRHSLRSVYDGKSDPQEALVKRGRKLGSNPPVIC